MKIMLKSLLAIALNFLAFSASGSLSEQLDQLMASLPEGSIQGVQVQEANSGQILYNRNIHYNLLPASTLKVLTAFVAYQSLGAEFRFQTRLLSQHKIYRKPVYKGDLTLQFNGDPSLTHDDLIALLSVLSKEGVREIRGNIWLDNSAFDGYLRAGGTSWDDRNICFAAPTSAMILDRNCFFGWLRATKPGQKAKMEYDEPEWYTEVDNQIVTRKPLESELLGCVQEVWPSQDYEYRLEGCISPEREPMRMAFSVNNVERAVKRFVKSVLKRKGITLQGRVLVGRPKYTNKFLVSGHQSAPLPALLDRVLEKSDNLYADSLLKTLGRQLTGGAGSYYSGSKRIREVLNEAGVPLSRSRIVDGSGLSRYNLISVEEMNRVLVVGWQQWGEKAPWLANRNQSEYWLKSGYLNGVNNMAGYAFPDDGEPLIFTVMLNGLRSEYPTNKEELKNFHNNIRTFHRSFLALLAAYNGRN